MSRAAGNRLAIIRHSAAAFTVIPASEPGSSDARAVIPASEPESIVV
jgi:hypothetical protein